MNTLFRRTLLLSAVVVPLASSLATAQYRIDNGSARDANNRLGSGGYNDGRNDPLQVDKRIGTTGNWLVTGNFSGGKSFRGQVGYGDASSFRSRLGSADFDNFIRDSTGVGQIRGGYGSNSNAAQPFFGGRTVDAPAGFTRSPLDNGTYVARGPAAVLPNDARADYGGASRAQVTQSLIGADQRYGNAGLAPTTGAQYGGQGGFQYAGGQYGGSNFGGSSTPLQLSEFTTLARQRQNIFGGTVDETGRIDMKTVGTTPANPFNTTKTTPDVDPNAFAIDPNDNRSPSAQPLDARPAVNPDAKAGDTGQSLNGARGKGGVLENNSQYAQLRNRLDQARGQMNTKSADAKNGTAQPGSGQINMQTVGAGTAVSTGQGRIDTPAPVADKKPDGTKAPSDATTPNGKPSDESAAPGDRPTDRATGIRPGTDRATGDRPTDGGTKSTALPTNAAGSDPEPPQDKLNLPRPDGALGAVTHAVDGTPVQIRSLSAGVKDAKLANVLTQAEGLMKAGKYGSAIDAYEHAEEIASDDPLVFMGRSIAELGGGYYRNAEVHLRQAFAADESLLYAKFDLRAMLGDERLNQLATQLGDVANKSAKDPGPLMLLAFIYYNGGMEEKAARALDMAQVRAGGKDKEVEALRRTWSLEAPAQMNK